MTNEQIMELINEFSEREMDRHLEWPERGVLTLVESDYEFAKGFIPEISVEMNLKTSTIKWFIDDLCVDFKYFRTVDDMCHTVSSMSFGQMIDVCVKVGNDIFKGVKNREQGEFMLCVNRYTMNEFDSYAGMEADGIIPLAYTVYTFGDGDYEIQVSFDINKVAFINYIDDKVVLVEPMDSLDQAGQAIEQCTFDNMILNCLNKGHAMYGSRRKK